MEFPSQRKFLTPSFFIVWKSLHPNTCTYLRDGAAGYRNNNIKKTTAAFNAVVTRLQVYARMYISRLRVRDKKEAIAEARRLERQRYLDEHESDSSDDSDDDGDSEEEDEEDNE